MHKPQDQGHATHEAGGYEKHDLNPKKVVAYGGAGIIVIVVLLIVMNTYYTSVQEQTVYEALLRPESIALRELRTRETEELNSYAVLDSVTGTYRIPIERAMKLLADEAYEEQMIKDSGK